MALVLGLLPRLERERSDLQALIAEKPEQFAQQFFSSGFVWAHLYEMPYSQLVNGYLQVCGLTQDVADIAKQARPAQSLAQLIEDVERPWLGTEKGFTHGDLLGYLHAIVGNLECLVIYGEYLNDLMTRAKSGDWQALFKAIRIDPTVVTAPFVRALLSSAVVAGDRELIEAVRKAMAGKTGRQAAYLKRFRLLMQILHEIGELGMPTKKIESLVLELGAYDDQPGASKNVSELIRKAKRMKQNAISK